ncbi:MAG: ssbA [Firmicutes bacterium]|nr:ssbA [Bacillota bacterium]
MNKATISGKAWEPETRYSDSGTCITQVSVSVYDGKDKDGKNQYFSILVKAFKELAEQIGNSIVKGDNVIAAGRLKLEKWDSQDGQKHSRMVASRRRKPLIRLAVRYSQKMKFHFEFEGVEKK